MQVRQLHDGNLRGIAQGPLDFAGHTSLACGKNGSEQEFDRRPVLWAFRRFYSIFDLCCSRIRGGGVQSRSSDGNRDIYAVVSDSF